LPAKGFLTKKKPEGLEQFRKFRRFSPDRPKFELFDYRLNLLKVTGVGLTLLN